MSSPSGPFAALPPQVDLPALEQRDPAALGGRQGLRPHLEGTARASRSGYFYEGPPTANGTPGTHHVEARAFKDVFPRFKTMQGCHVPRRAGWDCHGLPVELAVEKELGFAGKPDIEAYGIAEFNARCRESVQRHVDAFDRADPSGWATGSTSTTPTGRWTRLHRERLVVAQADLRQGPAGRGPPGRAVLPALRHRAVRPRGRPGLRDRRPTRRSTSGCPVTCGEWAGQGRPAGLDDDAVDAGRRNTAVAVHPDVDLRRRPHRRHGDAVVVAEPLLAAVLGEDGRGARPRSPARDWSACTYQRPFDLVDFPDGGALRRARRLRHHRGRHRAGAPGPRVRRRRPRRRPRATACRWSTRSTATGTSCADVPLVGGHVLQGRRRRRSSPTCRAAALLFRRAAATSTATRTAGAATRR